MPENNLEVCGYLMRVNRDIYPGLIDAAEEWVKEGWGQESATPPKLATAIINQANDDGMVPIAREQMLTVATNILNFFYRGAEWTEKPLPKEGT
jgi:hypothetical protein